MAGVCLLFAVLSGGAWYDIRERRIPNRLVVSGAVCGLGLLILTAPEGGAAAAAAGYLLRIFLILFLCFPLFLFRMIGAGDIKLMALTAGYLGLADGLRVIVCGGIAGAVLALAKLLAWGNLFRRFRYLFAYFWRMFLTKEIVPYYRAERDGYEAVIPFAACLLAGYLWHLLMKGLG